MAAAEGREKGGAAAVRKVVAVAAVLTRAARSG